MNSPLSTPALFHLGPVPISEPVLVTWAIMALLLAGGLLMRGRLKPVPATWQAALELVVDTVDSQIRDTMQAEPGPYRAFIGTLFGYILLANWSSLLPGIEPPTAHIETDAALALLVFLAVIWFGIRAGGVRGYLSSYASPSPLMIPLNFIESLTRTFSMLVRLFGNVMSGVFVVGIVLSLAGLLVPIPLMAARSADRRGAGLHLRHSRHGVHRRGAWRGGPAPGNFPKPKEHHMNWLAFASIVAAALAVSFGAIGPALAEGRAVAAAMDAIARQPEAANTVSRTLFVGRR